MDSTNPGLIDLDHNSLWKAQAEKERDVRVELGVYRGAISFAIFDRNKTGGPVFKTPSMPAAARAAVLYAVKAVPDYAPGQKLTMQVFDKWNPETKKRANLCSITFGMDNQNIPYLGFTYSGSQYKFPIVNDPTYDLSATDLDKKILNTIAVSGLVNALTNTAEIASRLSSIKRDPNQNKGGSGGGNRGSYGGGNRGGGGSYNNNRSSTPKESIEDSIPEF